MKEIKNYIDFINEAVAEPTVKPRTSPTTTPTPSRRNSPIKRNKPSVKPGPKADTTVDELAEKFLNLTNGDAKVTSLLKNKYSK